jgi:hypothetical protein
MITLWMLALAVSARPVQAERILVVLDESETPHSAAQREDFFGGLHSTHTNRRDKEDDDVTVSLL